MILWSGHTVGVMRACPLFAHLVGGHAKLVGKVGEHFRARHRGLGKLVLVRRVGRRVGVTPGPTPLEGDVELGNGAAENDMKSCMLGSSDNWGLLDFHFPSQFSAVSSDGAPCGGVGGLDAGPDGGDGGDRPEVGARHHVVESVLLQIGDMFPAGFRFRFVS